MSSSWIKLTLQSTYFTAGDKLNGDVLAFATDKHTRINIRVRGEEIISLESHEGEYKKLASSVFSSQTEIQNIQENLNSTFPFSFSLPDYLPASFYLIEQLKIGKIVTAEIFYIIEVELILGRKVIYKDVQEYTVFPKQSKLRNFKAFTSSTKELKLCWCIPRGISSIEIELFQGDSEINRFNVLVVSRFNKKLISLVCQVVCDVVLDFQEETINIRKILGREVYSATDFVSGESSHVIYEFESNKTEGNLGIGPNTCTNQGKFVECKFEMQVFAFYNIGCTSKDVFCSLPFMVNPAIGERSISSSGSGSGKFNERSKESLASSYKTVYEDCL